jgi:hypothetical protein
VKEDQSLELKILFQGVIPERKDEIEEFFEKTYSIISRCQDREGFIIESGPFGILKFTQRSMHQMWLLGFAAIKLLHLYAGIIKVIQIYNQPLCVNTLNNFIDLNQSKQIYGNIINFTLKLKNEENPSCLHWPKEIPAPWKGKPKDIDGAAAFDLICISGAYVFLHEIRHIQFCLENNAPFDKHDEELECDSFAKEMMLSKLSSYTDISGENIYLVRSKRAIGICFAIFYMLVLTPKESWSGSASHPSIKKRIEILANQLELGDEDSLWVFMAVLFCSHLLFIENNSFSIKFATTKELAISLVEEIENASNKKFNS